MEAIGLWENKLCELSTSDRAAVTARFVHLQQFFAKFATEIVLLQKPDLRSVVMSNQAHKHTEWMQAHTFFRRDFISLTVEEKDLLQDWELVLCDTSVALLPRPEQSLETVTDTSVAFLPRPEQSLEGASALESVAFLPRLQRCFQRVDSFVTEHAEALKQTHSSLQERKISTDLYKSSTVSTWHESHLSTVLFVSMKGFLGNLQFVAPTRLGDTEILDAAFLAIISQQMTENGMVVRSSWHIEQTPVPQASHTSLVACPHRRQVLGR